MTAAAVFEAHNLGKVYRPAVRALEGITLAIGRGGFTVVAGPSRARARRPCWLCWRAGAPGSGRLVFDGQDLDRCSDAAWPGRQADRLRLPGLALIPSSAPGERRLPAHPAGASPARARGRAEWLSHGPGGQTRRPSRRPKRR